MEHLEKEMPHIYVKYAWIECNASMDKKPGSLNILTGRGISSQAKCVIPEAVLNKYLNTTSEVYLDFVHHATKTGLPG